MKLDATDLRYISSDEFRVLTAVEMGSKNHEIVPTSLIAQISHVRTGGVNKLIGELAKRNLVARVQNAKYDGYRLTYGGYDYLAMRAMSKRDTLHSIGNQIGVGKESDIYIVSSPPPPSPNHFPLPLVLKIHRLGRISFRTVKANRDYMGKRKSASWMYMSRLAAQKEWAFMKVLWDNDFPVPRPIDQARHTILMEWVDGWPLRQVAEVPEPGKLYSELMDIVVRLAKAGLIHGDFNEFNILITKEGGRPVVIDFPQMVSTSHPDALWYFNRDVNCIRTFFKRRFGYESALYPKFTEVEGGEKRLDIVVEASGFGSKEQKTLENYLNEVGQENNGSDEEEEEEGEESEEEFDQEQEQEDELDEAFQKLDIAPPRDLSRSPPRSTRSPIPPRAASPTSSTSSTHEDDTAPDTIRQKISNDLQKSRTREKSKYHSKNGAKRAGRPQGSKAKQDTRVKLDRGGLFWD